MELKTSQHVFFSDSIDAASQFCSESGKILEGDIIAKHPFAINWCDHSWGGGFFPDDPIFEEFLEYCRIEDGENEAAYWEDNGLCVDMFACFLENEGCDLLIADNVREDSGIISNIYVAMPGAIITESEDN